MKNKRSRRKRRKKKKRKKSLLGKNKAKFEFLEKARLSRFDDGIKMK